MSTDKSRITPREILFVNAYAAGKTKLEAVQAAGLSGKNATKQVDRFLSKPAVRSYLDTIQAEAKMIAMVDSTTVLARIAAIAFVDSKDIFEIAKNPNAEWSDHARAAVSSITITKSYRDADESDSKIMDVKTEVRSRDTLKALKMLGDHLGSFTGLNSLLSGLKSYGIEIERVDGQYVIKSDDSDPSTASLKASLQAEAATSKP